MYWIFIVWYFEALNDAKDVNFSEVWPLVLLCYLVELNFLFFANLRVFSATKRTMKRQSFTILPFWVFD